MKNFISSAENIINAVRILHKDSSCTINKGKKILSKSPNQGNPGASSSTKKCTMLIKKFYYYYIYYMVKTK